MDTRAGYVDESDSSFYSRTFIIWYCDEEIEINDLCCFWAEVDVEEDYLNTEFWVEVELHFIDMSKLTAKNIPE